MKLLVPFAAGLLLLIPVQTYYAEKFHNNYNDGYFEQYKLFFMKVTDLSGYIGGFTPAHLWFILYLFVISLIALVVILFMKRYKTDYIMRKMNLVFFICLAIPVWAMNYVLNIWGKSIEKYFILKDFYLKLRSNKNFEIVLADLI